MNKIAPFPIVLILTLLLSCKKNNDEPFPPDPDNRLPQLVSKILRYEVEGKVVADTTRYAYDEAGHMIGFSLNNREVPQSYIYEGDKLTGIIINTNGQPDTLKNRVALLDNGNTIFMDFTRPAPEGGIDTIHITYKWSGNKILESQTYLNLSRNGFGEFQKSVFSYDNAGNHYETFFHLGDGPPVKESEVLEYDQNKNYFSTTSRLDYVLMGWGLPYATRSINNPTKIKGFNGEIAEYIWTYNIAGYPITMQRKGQNFVALELQYNK